MKNMKIILFITAYPKLELLQTYEKEFNQLCFSKKKQKESKFQESFLWSIKEEGQHWEVTCAVRWEHHAPCILSVLRFKSLQPLLKTKCFRLFNAGLLSTLWHIIYNSVLNPFIHTYTHAHTIICRLVAKICALLP